MRLWVKKYHTPLSTAVAGVTYEAGWIKSYSWVQCQEEKQSSTSLKDASHPVLPLFWCGKSIWLGWRGAREISAVLCHGPNRAGDKDRLPLLYIFILFCLTLAYVISAWETRIVMLNWIKLIILIHSNSSNNNEIIIIVIVITGCFSVCAKMGAPKIYFPLRSKLQFCFFFPFLLLLDSLFLESTLHHAILRRCSGSDCLAVDQCLLLFLGANCYLCKETII